MSDVIEAPEAINSQYCGRGGWQGLVLQLVSYLGMYNEYDECLSVKLICNYYLSCTSEIALATNTPFLSSESGRTQRHGDTSHPGYVWSLIMCRIDFCIANDI